MTKKVIISLFVIVLLAALLRLWQLGSIPPSLDWDEASLGWNAVSFLQTGSDEYGAAHPIAIRSFNDYKPAGYVYALIPVIALLGPSEIAIRLVSALAGIGSIIAIFIVTRELTKNEKLSLLTSLLFAISPWSIQFSRAAFEANLALFGVITGIALFLLSLRTWRVPLLILSFISFWGAFYSYHSTKLFVPLLMVSLILFFRHTLFANAKWMVIVLLAIFFIGLLPAAKSSLMPSTGAARFSTVSIFSESAYPKEKEAEKQMEEMAISQGDLVGRVLHHRLIFYPRQYVSNYLSHFDLRFLFLESDLNNRHRAPDMGLILLWQLPFLLAGFWFVIKSKGNGKAFIFAWLLLAPLASAVTAPSPHAIRSLLILPPFTIISAYGVVALLSNRKIVSLVVSALLAVNVYYFAHQYFIHGPVEYAEDWQYGYKQMVKKVTEIDSNYETVYVTNYFDQPYIYFLLYGKHGTNIKNDGSFGEGFGKYKFVNYNLMTSTEKDALSKDSLFVVAPGDSTALQTVKYVIKDKNNQPVFYIGENINSLSWGAMPE